MCLFLIPLNREKTQGRRPQKSAYLGSAKRMIPPPQKGQERQLEQCHSKASDNWFRMPFIAPSTDSVYKEKKFLAKPLKHTRLQAQEEIPCLILI